MVRIYTRHQEKEFTTLFFFENSFLSSYFSFLKNQPSTLGLHSITDTESVRIHKNDLNDLYKKNRSIEYLGRIIIENRFLEILSHNMDLLCLTAESRYTKMFKAYKHLILDISVKHLASFLGVHPNSLSRIRAKM
ncbi:hypothetical protein ASG31_10395 [Chryseobacterium sp. Leaf404]|nr:hypothetical protein ASG31_10395 [Chryseobacterium sp. Leaf404]